jgi:hypothetical protein
MPIPATYKHKSTTSAWSNPFSPNGPIRVASSIPLIART